MNLLTSTLIGILLPVKVITLISLDVIYSSKLINVISDAPFTPHVTNGAYNKGEKVFKKTIQHGIAV